MVIFTECSFADPTVDDSRSSRGIRSWKVAHRSNATLPKLRLSHQGATRCLSPRSYGSSWLSSGPKSAVLSWTHSVRGKNTGFYLVFRVSKPIDARLVLHCPSHHSTYTHSRVRGGRVHSSEQDGWCRRAVLPTHCSSSETREIQLNLSNYRGAINASGKRSIVYLCCAMYMIGTPGIFRKRRLRSRSHVATINTRCARQRSTRQSSA